MADGAVTLRHRLRAVARRRYRTVETKYLIRSRKTTFVFCRSVRGARLHRRAFIVIILFALFIWRGVYIALHARDRFGTMLALGGITFSSAFRLSSTSALSQTPSNTGISLPFFSHGGTTGDAAGANGRVLSVSRHSNTGKKCKGVLKEETA